VALAAAVLVATLLTPGVAAAEGPGYGGGADRLTVKWPDARSGRAPAGRVSVAVYGVGFRGGSQVSVRVGSGADRLVSADAAGSLSILVAPANAGAAGLSSGTTVVALGRSPAGTPLRLVGFVPPEHAGHGSADLAAWTVAGLAALGLGGGVLRRTRRAGQGSKR
jgi:hypothetical protein